VIGLIGCFGGFCLHLLIGCLYQWGIVSVYVTSYFRTLDSTVTLEKNAIAFPLMMLSIGITMKLGLKLAEHIHPLIVMTTAMLLQCLFIFVSSFALNMVLFIAIYGVFFGLASGLNFMLTVY
jgi:hypothetical protein